MDERLQVAPSLYAGIAAALLLIPLRWLLAWMLSVFVHEMFHIVALKCLKIHIYRFSLSLRGASLATDSMQPWKELLCALAGPIGSLMLLSLWKWLPLVALCGFMQGLFNLLPIYPLDGGRVIRSVLGMFHLGKIPCKSRSLRVQ